jgi:nucleoside-diphosphate-sugar epimerase
LRAWALRGATTARRDKGRCSDNTLIRKKLGWAPSTPLRVGITRIYRWIADQLACNRRERDVFVS